MKRKQDSWRLSADPKGRRIEHGAADGFAVTFLADEIVVGDWLHVEQMDTRVYWLRIGDREADVEIDHAGHAIIRWRKIGF